MALDGEDVCFPLDGGRCPISESGKPLRDPLRLGSGGHLCHLPEHPRFIEEYGPFKEITLSAACPKANELLLGNP